MYGFSLWILIVIASVQGHELMEDPNLFEGDMILSPGQLEEIENGRMNRGAPMAATKINLWPRKIPYDYHELKWTSGRASIDAAIKAFEENTCLRFVRRTTEKGYMKFYNRQGCSTQVGYTQGPRRINLGRGCWESHIATHEMMHALGFFHEQSRPDRDNYVKVRYENILEDLKHQFKKRGHDEIDSLGVPYDYLSIMHYRKTSFSKNRGITIETLDPSKQDVIGEQKVLSKLDIKQINLLYKCNEPDTTSAPSQRSTTKNSKCVDVYDRCQNYKDKCTDQKGSTWYNWVKENCKQTCGLCDLFFAHSNDVMDLKVDDAVPPPPHLIDEQDHVRALNAECTDKVANCDAYGTYCKSSESVWKDFMQKYCAKKCGYCGHGAKTTSSPTKSTALPPIKTSPPWPKDCGIPSYQTSKVIGGIDAKPGAWPWQARLYKTNTYASFCGASLISTNWLVTAAHCVEGKSAKYITIHLGRHSLAKSDSYVQKIPVRRVIVHHSYGRPTKMNNDIALLQLAQPAILNARVGTVCLPKRGESAKVGTKCYITGWGKTKHPGTGSIILQQSDLDIVDSKVCHQLNYRNYRIRITDGMVCAGFGPGTIKSGCHGDSGGPLVCKQNGKFVLHGDVSWGSHTCDVSKGYTVFGRVSYYRAWMDQFIYT